MMGGPEYKWKTTAGGLVVPDVNRSGVGYDPQNEEYAQRSREWVDSHPAQEPVKAQVVKENAKTVWVKLPDGNIIKRKRARIEE